MLLKKDFTSLWSAFLCGAGHSCSSVISLLLISHFKHKDNRSYYAFTTTVWTEALHCLMFPNVSYVFVSFFLCLMIPWLVTVTKNLCLHDLCSAKLLSKQVWISRVVEFLIQIFMHKPVDKNINISHLNLLECATKILLFSFHCCFNFRTCSCHNWIEIKIMLYQVLRFSQKFRWQ